MKRLLILILSLVMLGCLWGCQSEKEATVEEGCTKYSLVSMGMENLIMSAQEARDISGIDDLYLKFYEDGTAKMRVGEEIIEMEYDEGYLWRSGTPDEKASYTIENDVVVLIDGGMVYTFKK